MEAGWKCQT
jgi:hypothetical protein